MLDSRTRQKSTLHRMSPDGGKTSPGQGRRSSHKNAVLLLLPVDRLLEVPSFLENMSGEWNFSDHNLMEEESRTVSASPSGQVSSLSGPRAAPAPSQVLLENPDRAQISVGFSRTWVVSAVTESIFIPMSLQTHS
ncbi:hypothetical protein TNCV_4296631 [Trichonephila clavipes]|nr:hypothetical protein TNCV_4296631 [Trichonephila clavipes]